MKTPRLVCLILVLTGSTALVPGGREAAGQAVAPTPGQHALLVGVTAYPELGKHLWLRGGGNDVLLMKNLLVSRYGFPLDNVTILSEEEGKKDARRLPTRANIERECRRLAGLVKEGEQVVVLLAGHGSRQPEPANVKDPQPDGFDKIFLPRDVRDWEKQEGAVPNAITGRQLGAWLRPIPQKKARLWVIVDACHSGQMLRGARETERQLQPDRDLKVPPEAMKAAEDRARKRAAEAKEQARGVDAAAISGPLARLDGVVLTYACLSRQTTLEGRYKDHDSDEMKRFGLLTHTLCGVLRSANEPLTYRELVVRVQNAYKADDRDWPTPVIEGTLQTAAVLGEKAIPRVGFLVTKKGNKLTVNAGQLHGLTKGTILAVYPPAGVKGGRKGHVRVTSLTPALARVEPVAHDKMPAPAEKEVLGGRCEVAEVVYGNLKLKVAVDRLGSRAKDAKQPERLTKLLERLAGEKGAAFEVVADQAAADWLLHVDGDKVFLLPRVESAGSAGAGGRRRLGPAPADDKLAPWLNGAFARIVRVRNLLALSAGRVHDQLRATHDFLPRVEVALERPGAKLDKARGPQTIPTFYHGDEVRFRMRNPGKGPVDVTVLYVNSQFGIVPLFPTARGGEFNRIEAGKSVTLPPVDVDPDTAGRESIVVIAVKAEGDELMDFAALGQPTIDAVRGVASKHAGRKRALRSGLGNLLENALYEPGTTSRMKPREISDYSAHVIPVQIIAGRRPAGVP